MDILILGSGGREHALAWAIRQNPKCDRLICAPGNAGIAAVADCVALDIMNPAAVVALAKVENIGFVIIGPEAPLAAGVADALRAEGILTFGPSAVAAQLESSKAFTKEICDASGAPTAAWARFTTAPPALAYVRERGAPIVIKADGLAAGKGVFVAMTLAEAEAAVEEMFSGGFGAAGDSVVIENFLCGEEASLFVLTDGTDILALAGAQDHKRAYDGDEGPNTGGMGAYSPAPVLSDALLEQALTTIIRPTIAEMAKRGTPFQGVLFAGLMIEDGVARLMEYNVRFGDPECQALMVRLGGQMLDALLACAEGQLANAQLNWADDHAVTVVMAAQGYPGAYRKGEVIGGIDAANALPGVQVFHAGTTLTGGQTVSNGGRVLNVTARANSLQAARDLAYQAVALIEWPGGYFRKDICYRAIG